MSENGQLKKEKSDLEITIQGKNAEIEKLKDSRKKSEDKAAAAEQRAVKAEQTVRQQLDDEWSKIRREKAEIKEDRQKNEEDWSNIYDSIQKGIEVKTKDLEEYSMRKIKEATVRADERADKEIAEAQEAADKKSEETCAKYRKECDDEIEKTEKSRKIYDDTRKRLIGTVGICSAAMLYVCACIIGNYPRNEIVLDGEEVIGWIMDGVHFISGLIGGIPWAAVRVIVWIVTVLIAAAILALPVVLIKKFDGKWVYDLKNDEVSRTAFAISVSLPLFGTSALAARDINGIAAAAALYGIYIIIRSGCILKLLATAADLLEKSFDAVGSLADECREHKEEVIGWLKFFAMIAFTLVLIYAITLLREI